MLVFLSVYLAMMVICLFTIFIPIFIFVSRANYAKKMYEILYEPLSNLDNESGKPIEPIIIGKEIIKDEKINKFYFKSGKNKITIEDKTPKELLNELELIIKDALIYGEKLDILIMFIGELQLHKNELIDMCSKVRIAQWYIS